MDRLVQVSERQIEQLVRMVRNLRNNCQYEQRGTWLELLDNLEQAVWRLDAVSLASLPQQYDILAQKLAIRFQKKLRVIWHGFDLEVCSAIRNALSMSLVHVIRNSVDHGIELPEERMKAGKPEVATLQIRLAVVKGELQISMKDDGRGPDLRKILHHACLKGLVKTEDAQAFDVARLLSLLVLPGFSTSDSVTDISGRGVGLDAIRACFEALGGWVEARRGDDGGFELFVKVPLSEFATMVVPARIGKRWLCLRPDGFQTVRGEDLSCAQRRQAAALLSEFCEPSSEDSISGAQVFVRFLGGSAEGDLVAVNEVGNPVFRIFRLLDSCWRMAGPGWFNQWLSACEGRVFACSLEGQSGEDQIALYADPASISALVRRCGPEERGSS